MSVIKLERKDLNRIAAVMIDDNRIQSPKVRAAIQILANANSDNYNKRYNLKEEAETITGNFSLEGKDDVRRAMRDFQILVNNIVKTQDMQGLIIYCYSRLMRVATSEL